MADEICGEATTTCSPEAALISPSTTTRDAASFDEQMTEVYKSTLQDPVISTSSAIDLNRRKRRNGVLSDKCIPLTCCKLRIRFFVLFISVLFLTFTRGNEMSFNLTILCMTSNSTVNGDDPIYMTPQEISTTFASVGVGAIITVLPLTHAQHVWGSRVVFSMLLGASAISTALIAPLARISFAMIIPRLIQGAALASVMPLMGTITAEWAPVMEIGKFMTFLSGASQLSQIIVMPLSAELCVNYGWSRVYYILSILSGIVAVLFYVFYRNSPEQHSCISEEELTYITKGAKPKRPSRIPYAQIFRSRAVWAVWIAFVGNSIGFQLIIQFMPTFLNKVVKIPIKQTGSSAMVPPLFQLAAKITAVFICDRITFLSERLKLQVFNSIAMCGCGLFFLPLGFLDPESSNQRLTILCFTASISCLGMVTCGSLKSVTLVAKSLSPIIMGITQLVVCMGALIVPFFVSLVAPDNTIAQWRVVFISACAVLFVTNVIFCFLCSATPAPWALESQKLPTEIEQTKKRSYSCQLIVSTL
ncbi:MFS domain-containing protein [Aphelenchoides besseyi]|nr:MFS domain-containing protein [Aphelenchoides besseyi]